MPQMAPMNWMMLFMIFSLTFIIFNSMNFFFLSKDIPEKSMKKNSQKSMNWKW